MPKYRVKTSHMHSAGQPVEPGEILELDRKEGEHRTAIAFVEPYVEPVAEAPARKGKDKD